MPRSPVRARRGRQRKKPAWLNDVTLYHNRGNIDFDSCSAACFEQGDFFGLDDLFTEKPRRRRTGSPRSTALDPRLRARRLPDRHDEARQRRRSARIVGAEDPRDAARGAASPTSSSSARCSIDRRGRARRRTSATARMPNVLDFPFQDAARGYAVGTAGARGLAHAPRRRRLLPHGRGVDAYACRRSSATTTWAAPALRRSRATGAADGASCSRASSSAHELLYLSRGAPVVYYGDEVGMIGTRRRQGRAPGHVPDAGRPTGRPRSASARRRSATARRSTSTAIRSRTQLRAARRAARREPGALDRLVDRARRAAGSVLVVSRIDPASKREYVDGVQQRRGAGARRPSRPRRRRRRGRRSSARPVPRRAAPTDASR